MDDARELIHRIAVEQKNDELVSFLDTPDGRYHVRATHHLAGGNHRLHVLLSHSLPKES